MHQIEKKKKTNKQFLPLHSIDHVLVEFDESVDGSFANFQGGQVGKEVVTDKEAEEYLQQVQKCIPYHFCNFSLILSR